MNVRGGPGTNYPVVGTALTNQKFDITGKNAAGDWWRIDYKGNNVWIYAPFVTATNADRIVAVPTPVPPTPTPQPTATPRPQTTQIGSEEEIFLYAAAIVIADQTSMGRLEIYRNSTAREKAEPVDMTAGLLVKLSPLCDMSIANLVSMVHASGQVLDDAGYTARTGLPARQLLTLAVTQWIEQNPHHTVTCAELFAVGVQSMLESE